MSNTIRRRSRSRLVAALTLAVVTLGGVACSAGSGTSHANGATTAAEGGDGQGQGRHEAGAAASADGVRHGGVLPVSFCTAGLGRASRPA